MVDKKIEKPIAKDEFMLDKMLFIAKSVLDSDFGQNMTYCLEDDSFYLYGDGYWKPTHSLEVMDSLMRIYPKVMKYSLSQRRNIIDNMKIIRHMRVNKFNVTEHLNLINGMADPYTGNITPHEKEFYSTLRLPYKFDAEAGCPLWLKTIDEIFEGNEDKKTVLQEFFGYALTRETRLEKALLLLGNSRSGKSTIISVLMGLVGENNYSTVALKHIANQQYTPMMVNKLVNVDSDVSDKAFDFEAEFKVITSGEEITCNQKFIETYKFKPFCKLVLAANIFPRITDHSSAFYKRLLLIPCDRVFLQHEQNIYLKDELRGELSGILNWAISGLKRLKELRKFTSTTFMSEAIAELEDSNNPTNIFFKLHINVMPIDQNCETEKRVMYEKYVAWCRDNRYLAISAQRFGAALYNKYVGLTQKDAKSATIYGRPRVWKNLQYVDNKDAELLEQEVTGWKD